MADAWQPPRDTFPKTGRVNEMCREWIVREDGALAYQLQNQEINEHYTGNKHRNALVREDFPKALDEQLREQQLAEQAAAVYHRMLSEQEEIDNQIAKELAMKIQREEEAKRRALEMQDQHLARQMIEKERIPKKRESPQKPTFSRSPEGYSSPHKSDMNNYYVNTPRRQARPMPLPDANSPQNHKTKNEDLQPEYGMYTEPYNSELEKRLNRIDIAEIGVPIDEINEREIQEKRDAELARQLQEEEDGTEESRSRRDRLLAMEAQDKELAKLLQERERAKAKRAKERAKQKALAKKQQAQLDQQQQRQSDQIMPDDSYACPLDSLPHRTSGSGTYSSYTPRTNYGQNSHEEDVNYSFPVDILPTKNSHDTKNYNQEVKMLNNSEVQNYPDKLHYVELVPPVRPNQLDLKSPLNKPKQKYSEPHESQLVNIAMAIDPTYPRKSAQSPPSYDTSSSTVTTSTSSSSPGIVLPPPDISELEDDETSPVPPYMPIQGQRRTSSLEKKQKKKGKDGCKQQ